jgi:hypothetical protein
MRTDKAGDLRAGNVLMLGLNSYVGCMMLLLLGLRSALLFGLISSRAARTPLVCYRVEKAARAGSLV